MARLGGDEFAILLEQLAAPRDAAFVARKVLTAFSSPFRNAGQELRISASIGISLFPMDGRSIEELLRNADRAMYRAKQQGGDRRRAFGFATDWGAVEQNLGSGKPEKSHQPRRSQSIVTRAPVIASATKKRPGRKVARVAADHKRMLALLDELLTPSTARSIGRLAELLKELYNLLMMHFADEERRGGFFDVVNARSTDHSDEIQTLVNQHFQVLSELAALLKLSHASSDDTEAGDGPFELFLGAAQLAHSIKNHEQRENKLIANLATMN